MQKKLIALAIAGLAAAPAFAQSNVTIYGRIDYGFQSRNGSSGGVGPINGKSEMAPGLEGGSRLGFKGAEDLGNGLKAIFEMEFGSIQNDVNRGTNGDGNGLDGTRHAYVGLTGNFGTVVGGRLDGVRYGIYNKFDPFGGGGMGNFTQMTAQVDRADNAVAYISPSFSGLTATLAYSTSVAGQEAAGNRADNRLQTAMLAYDNGPISANLDYEQIKTQGAGDHNTLQVYTAGAAYDFGVVKVSALYDVLKAGSTNGVAPSSKIHSWFVGAKAPVGQNIVLKAVYGRVQDKVNSDADARKWGLGADYLLSKRTNLYADYGSIHNDSNAAYQINAYANSGGAGYGTRGFDIGIAHKF